MYFYMYAYLPIYDLREKFTSTIDSINSYEMGKECKLLFTEIIDTYLYMYMNICIYIHKFFYVYTYICI
jgi:hypothetical protein